MIRFLLIFLISGVSYAQRPSTAQVSLQTSAKCGMCKSRIECDLGLTKGVEKATLRLTDKVVVVDYNPKKTNIEALKKAISMIGYDADEIVANQNCTTDFQLVAKSRPHLMWIK